MSIKFLTTRIIFHKKNRRKGHDEINQLRNSPVTRSMNRVGLSGTSYEGITWQSGVVARGQNECVKYLLENDIPGIFSRCDISAIHLSCARVFGLSLPLAPKGKPTYSFCLGIKLPWKNERAITRLLTISNLTLILLLTQTSALAFVRIYTIPMKASESVLGISRLFASTRAVVIWGCNGIFPAPS